jgi:serine/threonine protein kinase
VIDHFSIPEQGQYLVMDFVQGQSLYDILMHREEPVDEREALDWITQVCDALDYLHTQDQPIIHRDIKPQNIIATPEGLAVLVDFGLSKLYDEEIKTTSGAQGVTFGYAPPEQYGQGSTDERTDVYALGATLYAMLTHQRPPDAIKRIMDNVPLVPPRTLNPQISSHVEQAIIKAMNTNTSSRFQSVVAFRRALTKSKSNTRPIKPIPDDDSSNTPVWVWTIFIGLLLMVLLFTFGGIAYLVFDSDGDEPTEVVTQPAGTVVILHPTFTPTSVWTRLPAKSPVIPIDMPLPTDTSTPTPVTSTPTLTPTPTLTSTPKPSSKFQYELLYWSGEAAPSLTRFSGNITDMNSQPVSGVYVRASCYDYTTISYPSGENGFYDIFINHQPVVCPWSLTVVDTDDRQNVKAELSDTMTIQVTENQSVISANWRKNW